VILTLATVISTLGYQVTELNKTEVRKMPFFVTLFLAIYGEIHRDETFTALFSF
jgi:hypothetical protein